MVNGTPPHFEAPSSRRIWRSIGISLAVHMVIGIFCALFVLISLQSEPPAPTQSRLQMPSATPPVAEDVQPTHDIVADVSVDVAVSDNVAVVIETDFSVDAAIIDETVDPVATSEVSFSAPMAAIGTSGGGQMYGAFGGFGAHLPVRLLQVLSPRARVVASKMLSAYGGSQESEAAVELALQWFADHQSPNGMWDVDGYVNECRGATPCEPGSVAVGHSGDIACTAYALLCFAGAGYDHQNTSPYRETIRLGLDWLLQQQRADGAFGPRNYEHPVAAMAVAELCAMTDDKSLMQPLQAAVDVIAERQNPAGGWDYDLPSPRNDASVTGWNIMARKAQKLLA